MLQAQLVRLPLAGVEATSEVKCSLFLGAGSRTLILRAVLRRSTLLLNEPLRSAPTPGLTLLNATRKLVRPMSADDLMRSSDLTYEPVQLLRINVEYGRCVHLRLA